MPVLVESVKRLKIHKTSLEPLDNSGVIPNIDSLTIVHSNVTMVYKVNSISLNTADTYLLEVTPSKNAKPANTSNALTIFVPYSTSKFSNSDYNTLYGNYIENKRSNLFMEASYNTGTVHPTNLSEILNVTASPAETQDSNYTSIGFANARYYGSRNMSPDFNIVEGYGPTGITLLEDSRVVSGLEPAAEQTNPFMLVFDRIESTYNEYNGGLAAKIAYIVDEDGNTLTPNKGREGFNIITQGFPATSQIDIELSDNTLFGINMASVNGTYNVKFSGQSHATYLYTHTGSLGGYKRLDELIFEEAKAVTAGYTTPEAATVGSVATYDRTSGVDDEVRKWNGKDPSDPNVEGVIGPAGLFTGSPYNTAFPSDGNIKAIFTLELDIEGEDWNGNIFTLGEFGDIKVDMRLLNSSGNVKQILATQTESFSEKKPPTLKTYSLQSAPIDIIAGEKVDVVIYALNAFESIEVTPKAFEIQSEFLGGGSNKVLYRENSLPDTLTSYIDTNTSDADDGTYTDVIPTGGSGSGGILTVAVVGGVVTSVQVTHPGLNYADGDILTISNGVIGGSTDVTIDLDIGNLETQRYIYYWNNNTFSFNPDLRAQLGRFYEGPYTIDTLDEDRDFDPVVFKANPIIGDTIRFNNDESTTTKITSISTVSLLGAQVKLYTVADTIPGVSGNNGPQSVTFNRMVQEPVLIVDGYKPAGQTSRGLIKPQYMSDKLVNNFSKIVGDLKEKNLI